MAASPAGLKEASMFMVGFIMVLPLRLALACAKYALGRFHLPVSKLGVFIKLFHNPIELGGLAGFAVSNTLAEIAKDKLHKAILSTITNWLMYLLSLLTLYVYTSGGDLGNPNLYLWTIVSHYFLVGLNVTFSIGTESDAVTFFNAGVPLSSVFVAIYHKVFLYYADKNLIQDVDYWLIFGQGVANCVFMYMTACLWTTHCTCSYFQNGGSAEQQQQNGNKCCKCCTSCAGQGATCKCCCCCCCKDNCSECTCSSECRSTCSCPGCEAGKCCCCCCCKSSGTQCPESCTCRCTESAKNCKCCNSGEETKPSLSTSLGTAMTWSPFMLTVFSLGAFYCVYPGIAPFLLADSATAYNIEIINLIVHPMPALVICILDANCAGPGDKWESNNTWWNVVWIIEVYALFCVYTCYTILHYPDSFLGKMIIGNAALVGFMTVSFVTVQEGLKSVGLSAVGVQEKGKCSPCDQLPTMTLAISLAILNFTNFLGDGYLQTYRKTDKENWPTEGYTRYRGFKFWLNAAFRLAKKNLLNAFNVDVRGRTLM